MPQQPTDIVSQGGFVNDIILKRSADEDHPIIPDNFSNTWHIQIDTGKQEWKWKPMSG
jgi:hypothetical protein